MGRPGWLPRWALFQRPPGPRAILWLGVAIVLLAFALRVHRLGDASVWWDEGWSIWLARFDPLEIARRTASDEHPPLHYWLLHYWDALAGETEFAVRYSTVFFAMLSVPLIYRLGISWLGLPTGIFGALFLALARFHLWWSQEIKMYALVVFLGLLSIYLFVRLLRRPRWVLWVAWGLCTWAVMLTHYIGVLVPVVENLAFAAILFDRQRRSWRLALQWGLAQAAVALLYLPWVFFYFQRSMSWVAKEPFDTVLFLHLYATVLSLGISFDLHRYTLAAVIFAFIALVGIGRLLMRRRQPEPEVGWMVAACLLGVPLIIYLLSLPQHSIYQPKMIARYLVVFLPLYGLALAQGVGLLGRLSPFLGGVALVFVFGVTTSVAVAYHGFRYPGADLLSLDETTRFLRAYARPEDAIILYPDKDGPIFRYRLDVPRPGISLYEVPYGATMSPRQADHWLDSKYGIAAKHDTVWLVTPKEVAQRDPKGDVMRWLSSRYRQVEKYSYGQTRIVLFRRGDHDPPLSASPPPGPVPRPHQATFGDLTLLGFDSVASRFRTGMTIRLTSYWRAEQDTTGDYQTRLFLVDTSGRNFASKACPLRPGSVQGPLHNGEYIRAESTLNIGNSIPSGRYRVEVEVEEAKTTQRARFAIGEARIHQWQQPMGAAGPEEDFSYKLGGKVKLIGYASSPEPVQQGEVLKVILYWKTIDEMDMSYTVFVHLLDSDGKGWTQADTVPCQGSRPTNTWEAGERIVDVYEFYIGRDFPPGRYTLAVGMYDPATGERLVIDDLEPEVSPDNRILIPRITIVE